MINVDYKGVEIADLAANLSDTFVAGRPVTIAASQIRAFSGNVKCVGLIKESSIPGVINELSGYLGTYGSGKGTVLMDGVATVKAALYNGVSYNVYNQAVAYNSGDELYADPTTGVITNIPPTGLVADGLTGARIGYVLVPPTNPANGDPMTIRVMR